MMTSVAGERLRGTREKTQITPTPTQPQKQVQATAEQIRLAQMIYDKNDADFEDKVNQLVEVTGKNQDDCMVALHDCNGDVHRAINILLEGNSDTTTWETVGVKKKSNGKECSENKENREKRGERELSRGRGTSSRRARGGSRVREFRIEENGVDALPADRPLDRGRRGRGRGFGGRGRGRGGGRFSSQGMGTFNPADYSEPMNNDGYGIKSDVWDLGQADGDDGTGAWRNAIEEYAAEDWNEDLSETKVFTASSVPVENHITPGQSIDLVALLQNTSSTDVELGTCESSQSFGQALVFTNSHHSSQLMSAVATASAVTSYSPPSLSSVLGSAFGDLATSKMSNSATSPILEHLKSPSLSQFPAQSSQHNSCHTVTTSSWDIKPYSVQSSVLSQFDFKSQPEPSPVLSQLTQRQQHQTQQVPAPPPGLESFSSHLKLREQTPVDSSTSISKILQLPSMPLDSQAMSVQPTQQQKQMKPQKRRIPPASKIPASAVEMPGAAEVQGLNVQFGALEFGTEASLPEFGLTVNNERTSPISNSLFSKSTSEPLNTSQPVSITAHEPTHTASVINAASPPSTSPVTTTSPSNYEQTSVLNRVAYQSTMPPLDASPVTRKNNIVYTIPLVEATISHTSKWMQPGKKIKHRKAVLLNSLETQNKFQNGHSGTRTVQTANTVSAAPVSNSEGSSLSNGGQLPSAITATTSLLQTVPQHSSATTITLSTHPQSSDLNSATLSQLSSTLSSHQNSLSSASALPSNTSHTHTSVEIASTLQPTATFCTASPSSTNTTSTAVGISNSMNATNSLTLNVSSVSMPAANTRPPPLVSSGKAPPNLPQGVPPLLHSQYIMGPSGLLPAYPQIYGYDDLQMLQSRLPMDYYGIPFPAPATLTGRDGGLANNPYSGDVAKFGRPDSASPAPATTLSQPQQNQTQAHHAAQQPFINPGLPPGYSYPGLSYYASMPGVPSAFPYGPTVFVPPTSAKHGVNLNAASAPFQQASAYGQHGYGTGYDDLTQVSAAGDYSKGVYSGSSQAQNKSAGSGPGKGVSVSSSNTGVPDISGSVYNKAQAFDKQAFHAGTPPPFNLPSALGTAGPMNPGAAAGYAPAPFLHILPHQQAHSQMLHHHLQQDGQGVSGQRSQPNTMQQKSQANKTAYASSPYWTN